MQIRYLFFTSLLLGTPALAFPSLQDQEAPSQEIIELAERARAQAELARVEVDLLLEQAEAAQEGVEVKHLSLATRAMALEGQDPDRGYLGIEMVIEGEAMVVRAVMPGSGADKAGLKAGDRILRVNKIKLDQEGAVENLKGLKAGKKAKVTFERDGEEEQVTVSLSPLPALDQDGEPRVQVNRLRRVLEAEEGEGEDRPMRRFRVRTPVDVDDDHSESDSPRSPRRAIVKVLSEDGQERVMDFKLDGQDLEGLPGNIREHVRELLREHGGEGEHQVRVRMERNHEEDGEEHDVRVLHFGDGGGRRMNREIGVGLEGLPEHIRELIKEHQGDGDERAHDIFVVDGEHGDEHDGHDAEQHEVHVLHLGERGGRDLRFGGDGNFRVEVEHDGPRDHNGPEVNGRAIIKMLTGDGERRMEFDFDGADLREMGGRVRRLMAGRDVDLWDVLARVRGDRNDRSGDDSRGLHREEDHDGRGDGGERNGRGDRDSREMHRAEDRDGRGDRGERNGRGDRDSREMHREEDHDGRGDRGPRGLQREQDRGMDRTPGFGQGRGMGMMRGRGRGGPDMFPHEDHDDGHGQFEGLLERIEELEQRIEELEELLERVRGRRNR